MPQLHSQAGNNSFMFNRSVIPNGKKQTYKTEFEKKLMKKIRALEPVFSDVPAVYLVYDLEKQMMVYASPGIEHLLGYSDAELKDMRGKLLKLCVHPGDYERQRRAMLELTEARDHDVPECRFRVLRKTGQVLWIHAKRAVFERDRNGRVNQIITALCNTGSPDLFDPADMNLPETFDLSELD